MISLWDILWLLFMLGAVGAVVFVGMKEKSARKKAAAAAAPAKTEMAAESQDGFGGDFPNDQMQFDDFK